MNPRAAVDSWLFRLHGPEATPIVLNQRRVFILPTPAGLAYAIVLLLMLIASVNYNLGLGYMLTFLLGGLGIVTILHTFANLAHLVVHAGRVAPVTAGEIAHFHVSLTSDKDRPALEFYVPEGSQLVSVAAGSVTDVDLPVRSRRRGWLRPGRITLVTRYPLGLLRAWSYLDPDVRGLVYPTPETDPPPLPLPMASAGTGAVGGFGSDDFAGLRKHQLADPPRHIAWKAVARGTPLLTKQFSGLASAILWLDWRELPQNLNTEAKLSRLMAWLLIARRAGLVCGLRLPDQELAPTTGDAHFQQCLQALALFGLDDGGPA